jgi:hypothetical protein
MPKIKVCCRFNYHNGGNIIPFGSHETEYDSGSFAEIHIIKIERSDSTFLGTLVILVHFRHFRFIIYPLSPVSATRSGSMAIWLIGQSFLK